MNRIYILFFLLFFATKANSKEIPAAFIPNAGQLKYNNQIPAHDVLYYYSVGDITILFQKDLVSYIIKTNNKSNLAHYNAIADTNEVLAHEMYSKDSSYFYRMDIRFSNSLHDSKLVSGQKSNFYYNFYLGNDIREKNVYASSEIIYKNIYEGVDIKFYAKNGGLKYDIIIHPNGNIQDIQLEYVGATISTQNNELHINTPIKSWNETIPKSFILENEQNVDIHYRIENNTIQFFAPEYNKANTLVIDPDLTWSTYYNAKQDFNYVYQSTDVYNGEVIFAARVDATFIPYLIAGTGAYFDNTIGGSNDFLLLKFNSSGIISWATFFGSSGSETFKGGIRFDKNGKIYFLSANSNNDMPTQTLSGAYSGARSSSGTSFDDIHISRFSNTGILEWATWIPCDYYHEAADIAIGPSNQIYITGYFGTYKFGTAFPMVNPGGGAYFKGTKTALPTGSSSLTSEDAFLIEFNPSCQLVWSTYIGDYGDERIRKIAVAPNGTIFLSGNGAAKYVRVGPSPAVYTYNNPLLLSAGQFYDANHQNGANKLYLMKFNSNRSLAWASYFGNTNGTTQSYNQSYGSSLLSDSQNNIYVVDGTTDASMPIVNRSGAYNQSGSIATGSSTKLYILRFANNTQLTWSTYFSGAETNGYWRVGAFVDFEDELYVVAGTPNSDHPTLAPSVGYFKATKEGNKDGIVSRFSSAGALLWSTYFGGINDDDEVKQVVVSGARGCVQKDIIITGRSGGTTWNGGTNSWPVINPGGGAHIENYPGSSFYQVGIARFSVSTAPLTLANDNDTRTCPCSGSAYTHFMPSGTNRIIASINPNGQNLGNTTVTAYVQSPSIIVNDCNNSSVNFQTAVMGRRFKITPTTQPSSNVNIRLYFSQTEFNNLSTASVSTTTANSNDNITTLNSIKATRFSASTGNLAYENGTFPDNCGRGSFNLYNNGGTGNANTLFTGFDATGRYAEFVVPGFSEMWLHGKVDPSPLPVELLTFSALCQEKNIRINWNTASEQNNAYFQIDKSIDGESWLPVKRISGAGNSNTYLSYEIMDESPITGNVLYRLSQIDFDGTTTYFEPYPVNCKASLASINIYPNPAQNETNIVINSSENAHNASLRIMDITGKIIWLQSVQLTQGSSSININTESWPDGVYIAKIYHENIVLSSQKLIIRK